MNINKTQKSAQIQDISLILVRHAKALARDKAQTRGIRDSLRPLTQKGIERFISRLRAQAGDPVLEKLGMATCIYHSPFLRALQTAELLQDFLQDSNPEFVQLRSIASVTPNSDPKLIRDRIKNAFFRDAIIVVVSHEPFISNFLKLVFNTQQQVVVIKKGDFVHIKIKKVDKKIEYTQYTVLSFQKNGARL